MIRPLRPTAHFLRLIAAVLSLAACFFTLSSITPQMARAVDPAWTVLPLSAGSDEGIRYGGSTDHQYGLTTDRIVWAAGGDWGFEDYIIQDAEVFSWSEDESLTQLTLNEMEDVRPSIDGSRVAWYGPTGRGEDVSHAIQTQVLPGIPQIIREIEYDYDTYPLVAADRLAWCEKDINGNYQVFTWTPTSGVVQITSGAQNIWPGDVRIGPNRVFWSAAGGSDGGTDLELFTWSPSGGGSTGIVTQLTVDDIDIDFDASGDRVAWLELDGSWNILITDVWTWTPTGGSQLIAESQRIEGYSIIDVADNRVVWQVNPEGGGAYTLWSWTPSLSAREVVGSEYSPGVPAVSGDRIAFVGHVPGSSEDDDYEVFTWTPTDGIERVTDNEYDEFDPNVVGDYIAWVVQDAYDRPGMYALYDLFLAFPYTPDVTPPTTLLTASEGANPDSGWIINPDLTVTLERKLHEPGTTYYSYSPSGAGTVYSEPFTPLEGNRTLYYWSVDESGNTEARKTWPYKFDIVAPTLPTNVRVTSVGSYSVTLAWSASTDATSGLDLYGIYMDGPFRVSAPASATSAVVENLQPNTHYSFSLTAMDVAGNMSDWTADVEATTLSGTVVEDAPVAHDDSYSTTEGTNLIVNAALGLLANDTDPNSLDLEARRIDGNDPVHGNLVLDSDGSFGYYPDDGFVGVDTFTYRAYNGTYYSEFATVSVTVGQGSTKDLTIVPLQGAGRIETAVEVSKHGFTQSDYVIIATAYAFPDALGGSSLAGVLNAPILLTSPTALPDAVRNEIVRLGASQVIVLGGESAVNADVYNQLNAIAGVSVDRIWGANRYATAQAIASETISRLDGAYDGTAFIATGANFPDALGASPIAAAKGWPIYLANPNQGDNAALIDTMRSHGVTDALILGGPTVVSWEVQVALGSLYEDRLFGDNRYLTSVAVAQYGTGSAGLSWNRVAIATGANFPDALSGGALQGAGDSVMLLTPPTVLHSEVETVLSNNKASITEIRFLGGLAALSQTVRDAVVDALR